MNRAASMREPPPSWSHAENSAARRPVPLAAVGELTAEDADNEQHIRECAKEMQDAMARWEDTGCFAARGDADYWRMAMERAIAARSPAQVAHMERERGLE